MTDPVKVCFLADSHDLYDDRIYWKQAVSLKKSGFDVSYVLAGEKNDEGITDERIRYFILERDSFPKNRFINYLAKRLPGNLYSQLYKKAAEQEADIYHIHDLKVNRIGKKLLKLKNQPKLIYDVHEPYPENIIDYWQDSPFLKYIRFFWSNHIKRWERRKVRNYDMIITTEENMQKRFKKYFPGKPVEIIYNYTNLQLEPANKSLASKKIDLIYTGGITRHRGVWQILEATGILVDKYPEIQVLFVGSWFPGELKKEMQRFIQAHNLDGNVILQDAVPYTEINELYSRSKIGLGIFLPIRTHKIILQIKIFEYMFFGLPIIGSNFGHLNDIIDKYNCGITVDPENPEQIASAVGRLLSDQEYYDKLSKNGMKAAGQNFSWDIMETKLLNIYKSLLDE